MTVARFFFAVVPALLITLALFWLMFFLISNDANRGEGIGDLPAIQFKPFNREENLKTREREPPKKPPPPKEPPPPPKMQVAQQNRVQTPLPDLNMPNIDVPYSGSGPVLGSFTAADRGAEGDVIPLVRIEPQYPRQALLARVEGWVDLEFTITPSGGVQDVNVVRSQPPRVFDRAAMRAILKWKFKPRVINGEAVARRATQRLDFNFED